MVKLKAPMSYQGGKQRVADKITELMKLTKDDSFVDLCCGSGAVSVAAINRGVLPSNVSMVDASDWGVFWNMVGLGVFDLGLFEEKIQSIPQDRDLIKGYLEGISKKRIDNGLSYIYDWVTLQAGSFGGKHIWTEDGLYKNASFRSYWKPTLTSSRRSPVNPMMPMPETLFNQVRVVTKGMVGVKAECEMVECFDWDAYSRNAKTNRVVVYIDPPYENTTGYGFDIDYSEWLSNNKIPKHYEVWISDYREHGSDGDSFILSKTTKGGISGGSKVRAEILSRVQ